jgi:hypothetical protein
MHRWIFSGLVSLIIIGSFGVASAKVEVGDIQVEHKFGEYIQFQAEFDAEDAIQTVHLYIQPQGQVDTISSPALVPEEDVIQYRIDPVQENIRAFSTLEYWFETTLENGAVIKSATGTYYYDDNRFTWQERSKPPFWAYWHEGEAEFGQNILDVAQQGYAQIRNLLPVPTPQAVKIYAYANAIDMGATLQLEERNWVGAHTDPDLGVMVVSLPPGPEQRLEMERQIPHELMHIMLYQKIGPSYTNLPTWLNEGLASLAEIYPNSDYLVLLNSAYEKERLIPISSLCTTFPRDAAGAYLAYAQAASFTRFLHQEFGSSGLEALIGTYADGLDCERGIQVAFGSDMTQLELQWRRETFSESPWHNTLTNLAPWFILLAAVLAVPIAIVIGSIRKRN